MKYNDIVILLEVKSKRKNALDNLQSLNESNNRIDGSLDYVLMILGNPHI